MDKLDLLKRDFGYPDRKTLVEEALRAGVMDGICPAVCMNPECEYTCHMEPDQDQGFCELCEQNTVKSVLVITGMI